MVGRLGLLADSFIVFGYGGSAEMFDVRRLWYMLYGVRGMGCMTFVVHIVLRSSYSWQNAARAVPFFYANSHCTYGKLYGCGFVAELFYRIKTI